jgi:DNA-binding response OmpR family regulator
MAEAEILVVDDEPAIARLLQEFLEGLGFGVRGPSGQAALAAIDQSLPDAMLLDLYMPTVDGVEVLRHLRQRWPTSWPFAVIILTGRRDEPLLEAALALGAFDVSLKPINFDQLELALRTHLARRAPKPPKA